MDKIREKITYRKEGDYLIPDLAVDEDVSNNYKIGKYGYLNKKDEMVIQPKYDKANSFSEGVAFVKDGDEYYYINHDYWIVVAANNFALFTSESISAYSFTVWQ